MAAQQGDPMYMRHKESVDESGVVRSLLTTVYLWNLRKS